MDFKKAYQRQAVIDYLQNELMPEDFIVSNQPVQVDVDFSYSKQITLLGQCTSLGLLVFEIAHHSQRDARVALSREAFRLLSMFDENRAIVFFVPENAQNYRLSLVTITPVIDEQGVKIRKQYSNPRRYSFLLGVDAKTHTPEQFLIKKGRITSVDDLYSRFSVEVVNREFYQGIASLFSNLVGGKRQQGNKTIEYEGKLKLPGYEFSKNEQLYKEFAVRLIGRTVFCWFLKKKVSIKGIPLIPDELLSYKSIEHQTNVYHNIIEPLFFEILNTPIKKRKEEYKKAPYNQIPFLNGGLFEPHLFDFYENGQANYALKIPDEWWKEFLQFLETYNFTIDENTSIDIDLSVDPEMLGRIFENLLAEINPETGDTARKSTGSFYTPRAIVEFMVDESIKHYLAQQLKTKPETFHTLLDYTQESSGLTPEQEQQVLQAIQKIKILDPACGSGAFPMGMLQKILLILQKVDHKAQSSIDNILKEISDPIQRKILKQKLEAAHLLDDIDFEDYARKLSVIQNNIFGIDIQPVAVEISRLRFFLSLIVDEVIQDEQPNRGVEALPNLDFKFVSANSLIRLPEPQQFQLFDDYNLLNKLETIRADYFTANNDEKKQLRKDFEQIQQQIYQSLIQNPFSSSDPNSKFMLLANWKPFSNEPATWFDARWMFGITEGFDIVIGNPPYVQLQKDGGKLAKLYETQNYQTFARTGDIYMLFYEKGLELLKLNGLLCYITSNKWMRAGYGEKLREFFTRFNPILLIDLGPGVFENATVDTNILLIQKAKPVSPPSTPTVPQPSLVVEDNTPQQGVAGTGTVVPQPSLVVEDHTPQQGVAGTGTAVPQPSLVVEDHTPQQDGAAGATGVVVESSLPQQQDAAGTDLDFFFNPQGEIELLKGATLPHWRQNEVWYFVTFRLADSIPKHQFDEILQAREDWKTNRKKQKKPITLDEKILFHKIFSNKIEQLLDNAMGSCVLREPAVAKVVADTLLHFNHQRYELDDWVIMPNHVHVLVRPINKNYLSDILHSWKSYSAGKINELLGRKGQLWMHESYDHIVRNIDAFVAIKNYIRNNPIKAGITLCNEAQSWTYVPQPSLVVEKTHIQQQDAAGTDTAVPQPSLVVEETPLQQQDAAGTTGTGTVVLQPSLVVEDNTPQQDGAAGVTGVVVESSQSSSRDSSASQKEHGAAGTNGTFSLRALTLSRKPGEPLDINQQLNEKAVVLTNLTKDAWFIGSSAEQRLKEKIERIGKPLKEWDVKIYRGVLTGLNEAFIITTEKRNEILANCRDEAERHRTEAIIKPILRGRDIKRYYYEWAGLWVIGTFPALKLNIDDYPAIKKYFLDHFDIRQLEQSGKKYPELGFDARKKTGNEWFETQDQIAYYAEFEKEKIFFKAVGRNLTFAKVEPGTMITAPASFLTGQYLSYILGFLCSKFTNYIVEQTSDKTGAGDIMLNVQSFERIPIPLLTSENQITVHQIEKLVDSILEAKRQNKQADTSELECEIDRLVYRLYDMTEEEIAVIEKEQKQ